MVSSVSFTPMPSPHFPSPCSLSSWHPSPLPGAFASSNLSLCISSCSFHFSTPTPALIDQLTTWLILHWPVNLRHKKLVQRSFYTVWVTNKICFTKMFEDDGESKYGNFFSPLFLTFWTRCLLHVLSLLQITVGQTLNYHLFFSTWMKLTIFFFLKRTDTFLLLNHAAITGKRWGVRLCQTPP